mmetsp:Transcript_116559/g.371991  ORF Transcript_116559/g.371991 Transcript_116559/m.371991 type:complete len:219 (-) Transcript_116559:13-669(-)
MPNGEAPAPPQGSREPQIPAPQPHSDRPGQLLKMPRPEPSGSAARPEGLATAPLVLCTASRACSPSVGGVPEPLMLSRPFASWRLFSAGACEKLHFGPSVQVPVLAKRHNLVLRGAPAARSSSLLCAKVQFGLLQAPVWSIEKHSFVHRRSGSSRSSTWPWANGQAGPFAHMPKSSNLQSFVFANCRVRSTAPLAMGACGIEVGGLTTGGKGAALTGQ